MNRNPNYWGAPEDDDLAVEALGFPALPDNLTANCALRANGIDWAGDYFAYVDSVYVEPNPTEHHALSEDSEGTTMLYVNQRTRRATAGDHPCQGMVDRPSLRDVTVRKAMSLAIDRNALIEAITEATTADPTGLHPDFHALFLRAAADATPPLDTGWFDHNPQHAREILEDAEWRRGPDGVRRRDTEELRYTLTIPAGYTDWKLAVEHGIIPQLKAVGIHVSLVEAASPSAWETLLAERCFELTIRSNPLEPTPYPFYRRHTMGTGDLAWVVEDDPEQRDAYANALSALAAAPDAAQAKASVAIQRAFVRYLPAIPLFLGRSWGQFNTRYFTGFPGVTGQTKNYALPSPFVAPSALLVLTRLRKSYR